MVKELWSGGVLVEGWWKGGGAVGCWKVGGDGGVECRDGGSGVRNGGVEVGDGWVEGVNCCCRGWEMVGWRLLGGGGVEDR